MSDELTYDPIPKDELAANIDYLTKRAQALGQLIDHLMYFELSCSTFGLDVKPVVALQNYLTGELLQNETEREIFKADYESELKRSFN